MEVYCTRPSCTKPQNTIPDGSLSSSYTTEILCSTCQMPLILQGHFVALDLLGSGGFGRTFKAKDLDFPYTTRVIKQLHPKNTSGQILTPPILRRIEKMFEMEAITLDRLRHPRIPKFLAFFTMELEEETGYIQKFFYLVQDYIEGQNLAQELQKRGSFSEDEVINILKEILILLNYIHNSDGTNGVIYIHRDIKPANIIRCSQDEKLYLIDFGAVKQILQGLEVETTSIVLDRRFAPPEQFDGDKVSPASDLYATATTCLCLLTGITDTRELLLNSSWRVHVPVSDQRFAKALDEMLKRKQKDRPQSAQEVLKILSGEPDLDQVPTQMPNSELHPQHSWLRRFLDWVRQLPRRWRSIISYGFIFSLGIAIPVVYNKIHPPVQPPPPSLFANYFSRGEESLIPQLNATSIIPSCKGAYNFKQEGINAFKNASFSQKTEDFLRAENLFTQSINISNPDYSVADSSQSSCIVDPETFIYQYNSKVAQTASARNGILPTIAVAIPSESNLDMSLEILRGVAQVLKEQNTNIPLFQILLAKENNNEITKVKNVANYISNNKIPEEVDYFKKSQILGVIGRYTSRYIWEAGRIFGGQQLVLIAPTSTAIRKFDPITLLPDLHHYVFRTASNDSIAAKNLAEYMWDNLKLRKVLIIYESTDIHSKSLTEEFQNQLTNRDATEVNYQLCDLSASNFNKNNCINTVKNAEVKENALMLAPGYITSKTILNIAQLGAKRNFQILTGDVLYKRQISNNPETYNNKIVLAVFSHADKVKDNFKSQTKNLWGIKKVSWRTMTSYDATQAFVKALTDLRGNANPTRQNIYDNLNDPSFSASGATTEVKFDQDHDRKAVTGVGVLVQLNQSNPNSDEYGFTLLETPQRNNS